MEVYKLNTTQNVNLEYKIASAADRIVATLIDYLIIILYAGLIIYGIIFTTNTFGLWNLLFFVPVIFYHLIWELFFNGQSPGKNLMNIKVVKADGSSLSAGACFIRWIFRLPDISLMGGSIGLLTIIINGKGQRLGDIAASTTVIKVPGKKKGLKALIAEAENEEDSENYMPKFPQAEYLSDKDINIIKEVIKTAQRERHSKSSMELLIKTERVIANKLSLKLMNNNDKLSFLKTIVKDYYRLNR
ncbi:RDD family protein [Marinilabiliaceae bacterium ANBcel2]|nr:RDD family protein [Marinilabiliaceae bacterium ANBcel2]